MQLSVPTMRVDADSHSALTTSNITPTGKRCLALDGVRGLAILLVIFHHIAQDTTAYLPGIWFPLRHFGKMMQMWGSTGVDLFFVLSGFLITGILLDNKMKSNYYRNFYSRRALRIFPLYFGSLFIVLFVLKDWLIAKCPNYLGISASTSWLWFYGTNVIQSNQNNWLFGNLSHLWSLAVEEHFYIIWPLIVFYFSRRWLAITCFSLVAISFAARLVSGSITEVHVGQLVNTACRMDSLAAGGLIALIVRDSHQTHRNWVVAGLLAAPPGLLIFYSLMKVGCPGLAVTIEPLFTSIVFASLIFVVHQRTFPVLVQFFEQPALVVFGIYSYGLYVFHGLLRPPSTQLVCFVSSFQNTSIGVVAYTFVFVATSIAIAFLSFHCYEKHILSLKRFF